MYDDSPLSDCAFIEDQSRYEEMQFYSSVNDFLDIIDMGNLDEMMSFIKATYPEMFAEVRKAVNEA